MMCLHQCLSYFACQCTIARISFECCLINFNGFLRLNQRKKEPSNSVLKMRNILRDKAPDSVVTQGFVAYCWLTNCSELLPTTDYAVSSCSSIVREVVRLTPIERTIRVYKYTEKKVIPSQLRLQTVRVN